MLPLSCDPGQRDSLVPILSSVSNRSAQGTSVNLKFSPTLLRGGSADSRSVATSTLGTRDNPEHTVPRENRSQSYCGDSIGS